MNYETFEPHSALGTVIKCHWILGVPADLDAPKQRVIPDGCIEMCFILGDDVNKKAISFYETILGISTERIDFPRLEMGLGSPN